MKEISPLEYCGLRLAFCQCRRKGPHLAHVCPCGGAWVGSGNELRVITTAGPEHPDIVLPPGRVAGHL